MEKINPINAYFLYFLLGEGIIIFGLFDKIRAGFADKDKIDSLKTKGWIKLATGLIIVVVAGEILMSCYNMVMWNWFFLGVAMALAGAGILGSPKPKIYPRSLDVKHIEPRAWLENLIKEVEGINYNQMQESVIKEAIEKIEVNRLVPFVDNRHYFAHQYGLTRFAEFFSLYSTGEMYINRAWSSLVDNNLFESEDSLARAKEYFKQAYQKLLLL